jgi:hypothetical protein
MKYLLALILCLPLINVHATISAELDRNPITEQESVTLILRTQQQGQGISPDVSPLQHDFDIQSQSQSNQVTIVNSQANIFTEWRISLFPKRSGDIDIPPLALGKEHSPALRLSVLPVRGEVAADEPLFLSAELSTDSVYVQAQLIYTVRLYTRIQVRPQDFPELQLSGASVAKLGDDRLYETLRDEQRYTVVERRYAIFPENSGTLEIPAQTFTGLITDNRNKTQDPFFSGSIFDDIFNRNHGKVVRVRSQALSVQVKPQPSEFPSNSVWLPAQALKIEATWQPDPPQFQVGTPITRTLTVQGVGLESTLLPEISMSAIEGLHQYPDRPQTQTTHNNSHLIGERQQKYALVASQAGDFILPEIRIPWWDTHSDSLRYALVPEYRFTVTAAAPAPAPVATPLVPAIVAETAPAAVSSAGIWPWISAALASVWLITLSILLLRPHAPAPLPPQSHTAPDLAQARKQFNQACLSNDSHAAKAALLAWARARWPGMLVNNLGALAQKLDDAAAAKALAQIDQALYGADAPDWQAAQCRCKIDRVLEQRQHQHPAAVTALPRLYPQTLHS